MQAAAHMCRHAHATEKPSAHDAGLSAEEELAAQQSSDTELSNGTNENSRSTPQSRTEELLTDRDTLNSSASNLIPERERDEDSEQPGCIKDVQEAGKVPCSASEGGSEPQKWDRPMIFR